MKKLVVVTVLFVFAGLAGINNARAGEISPALKEKNGEFSVAEELRALPLDKMAITLFYIKYNYYKEVDMNECLEQIFEDGISGCTDKYSRFVNKEDVEKEDEKSRGFYKGIGIKFDIVKGTPTIVYVYPNSPAGYLGMMAGDVIVAISPTGGEADSVSVSGLNFESVIRLLDGKNSNELIIYVERKGKSMMFRVSKGEVKEDSIFFSKIDENIGYVKITGFIEPTANDFELVVSSLVQNGVKVLIIDLRNNPGGLLDSVINIIGFFQANADPVIYTRNRNNNYVPVFSKSDKNGIFKNQKVVALVNEDTASASEMLSGWLKEEKGAAVVGKATYGKDLVQKPFDLPDGSRLYLTVDQYFIGSKKISIGKVGVTPTIKVNSSSGKSDNQVDYQARKAVEVATEMASSF